MKKIFYLLFFLFFLGCSNLNLDKIDCNSVEDCPQDAECIAHKCKLKEAVSKCTEDKNCNTNEFCNNGVCEKSEACNGVECGEHGSCEAINKNDYKCNCNEGYINENENADSPCVIKNQCSNDLSCGFGTCNENGICECLTGFHFDEMTMKCIINGIGCKKENSGYARCRGKDLERCVKDKSCTGNCTGIKWGKWIKEVSPDSNMICAYNNGFVFWAETCNYPADCTVNGAEADCNRVLDLNEIEKVCIPADMCNKDSECTEYGTNPVCIKGDTGSNVCVESENCSEGSFRCSMMKEAVEVCVKSLSSNKTGWSILADCMGQRKYCKLEDGVGYCEENSCSNNGESRCYDDKTLMTCEMNEWVFEQCPDGKTCDSSENGCK